MRNRLLLFFMIVMFSTSLCAQHKPFQFGFKAGMNLGWFSSVDDDYKNKGVKFGASWGFAADFYLMDNYSITSGFDVIYLNGAMTYPDTYVPGSVSYGVKGSMYRNYRTKYIRLPIIFTMKTNEIKKLRYYGQIGFGLGFLLTAEGKDQFTPDNGGDVVAENHNIYDELRFTRESILIGAGVEIPIHRSTYARVGLLFDNAFANILKGYNTIDSSKKNNGRNSFIEINASVFF